MAGSIDSQSSVDRADTYSASRRTGPKAFSLPRYMKQSILMMMPHLEERQPDVLAIGTLQIYCWMGLSRVSIPLGVDSGFEGYTYVAMEPTDPERSLCGMSTDEYSTSSDLSDDWREAEAKAIKNEYQQECTSYE